LGRPRELRVITEASTAVSASAKDAITVFIASGTFPRAAPQGEKRAATSKPRRRRSDTSGTRFFAYGRISKGECPKRRFTAHPAHARRGPSLTRRPPWRVRAILLTVAPLAYRP